MVDGVETRVPDLLPGEAATVRVEHRSPHKNVQWATIVNRAGDLSPERAIPYCEPFGKCGGCVWQHLAYEGQLREKATAVKDILGLDEITVVPSPKASNYRNRAKYVIGGTAGDLILGAYAPDSQRVISTSGCQVVEKPIATLYPKLLAVLNDSGLEPYQEGRGGVRYVVVRVNDREQLLVAVVFWGKVANAAQTYLCHQLESIEGVESVVFGQNDLDTGAIFAESGRLVAGLPFFDKVAGVRVSVGATEFLQVNRWMADLLYREVADWLRGAERVVDLYSGVGGFTFALSRSGTHCQGYERNRESVLAANQALRSANLAETASFVAADLAKNDLPADFSRATAVIVNPPRKGISRALTQGFLSEGPGKIAYISCNPETLARDLAALSEKYQLVKAKAFDMMPGTGNVETAVLLVREGSK